MTATAIAEYQIAAGLATEDAWADGWGIAEKLAGIKPGENPLPELIERLRKLLEEATPGPWRRGADLIRVHPDWRDENGNTSKDALHRNGFAKTIASVGKEDGDWRPIEQQVADAGLIVEAVNALSALLDAIEGKKS